MGWQTQYLKNLIKEKNKRDRMYVKGLKANRRYQRNLRKCSRIMKLEHQKITFYVIR